MISIAQAINHAAAGYELVTFSKPMVQQVPRAAYNPVGGTAGQLMRALCTC
jgi:hypothetical protein